jgi:hypothetical protein
MCTLAEQLGNPNQRHLGIRGKEVDESEDFLFEVVPDKWNLGVSTPTARCNRRGAAEEITCSQETPNVSPESDVEIALFPRD